MPHRENFVRLQDELAGTENRISVERKRYNDDVRDFNQSIKRFPSNMVAKLFSFDTKGLLPGRGQGPAGPRGEVLARSRGRRAMLT